MSSFHAVILARLDLLQFGTAILIEDVDHWGHITYRHVPLYSDEANEIMGLTLDPNEESDDNNNGMY